MHILRLNLSWNILLKSCYRYEFNYEKFKNERKSFSLTSFFIKEKYRYCNTGIKRYPLRVVYSRGLVSWSEWAPHGLFRMNTSFEAVCRRPLNYITSAFWYCYRFQLHWIDFTLFPSQCCMLSNLMLFVIVKAGFKISMYPR